MTPSIAPAQPSHQAVSPTQGVPAPDGGPSPFEAYLGSLRKRLALSAFTLAPPAPSAQPQPAPQAREVPEPTEPPTQEASGPTAEKVEDAENSRPQAEPAPEEPTERKDNAEPAPP